MGCGSSRDGHAPPPKAANLASGTDAGGAQKQTQNTAQSRNPGERSVPPQEDYSHYENNNPQFTAVKAWAGAIVEPTNPPPIERSQPKENLQIGYAYGYKCQQSSQNAWYLSKDQVVYNTAALGIILTISNNTQQFLGGGEKTTCKGHNDEISAIAVSNDGSIAASGQCGRNPRICVWDLKSASLICQFDQGNGTRFVRSITISPDNKIVATLAQNDNNTISLFDTKSGALITKVDAGPDPIVQLRFNPTGNYDFASVGKNRVRFWTYDGQNLTDKKGLFGEHKMVDMSSCAWTADGKTCLTGAVSGFVYVWDPSGETGKCIKSFACHDGIIGAVAAVAGKIVTGGAKEITILDDNFNKQQTVATNAGCRSLDICSDGGSILAGLKDGRIVQIDQSGNLQTVMEGHCDGETWGLSVCPLTGLVVTTGDDNKILAWDTTQRKCVAKGTVNAQAGPMNKIGEGAGSITQSPPNQCARAVTINKVSGHVAVGTNDGTVTVRAGANSLDQNVATINDSKEWIEAIKYSPCGKFLAVGSHDNRIYVYDASQYQLISKFEKQTAFITGLDWSLDSGSIQSVSGSYELLFSNSQTAEHLVEGATALRDEQWASWTCKLGWPVQGIFPKGTQGVHIHGVHRAHGGKLLATGDEWRLVNIHRYPTLPGCIPKSYIGHAEFVTRVHWDKNDQNLYSIGGEDRTLIQWQVC
jgi:WD40 repeat protein